MISRVKFKIDNSNFRPENILFFIKSIESIEKTQKKNNDNGDDNDDDDEYNTYLHCGQVKIQWKKKS